MRWFWLDLPDLRDAPCGAVACNERGSIIKGAPVLVRRFAGWRLNALIKRERSRGRRVRWTEIQPP